MVRVTLFLALSGAQSLAALDSANLMETATPRELELIHKFTSAQRRLGEADVAGAEGLRGRRLCSVPALYAWGSKMRMWMETSLVYRFASAVDKAQIVCTAKNREATAGCRTKSMTDCHSDSGCQWNKDKGWCQSFEMDEIMDWIKPDCDSAYVAWYSIASMCNNRTKDACPGHAQCKWNGEEENCEMSDAGQMHMACHSNSAALTGLIEKCGVQAAQTQSSCPTSDGCQWKASENKCDISDASFAAAAFGSNAGPVFLTLKSQSSFRSCSDDDRCKEMTSAPGCGSLSGNATRCAAQTNCTWVSGANVGEAYCSESAAKYTAVCGFYPANTTNHRCPGVSVGTPPGPGSAGSSTIHASANSALLLLVGAATVNQLRF